jgi:hypothetical protein
MRYWGAACASPLLCRDEEILSSIIPLFHYSIIPVFQYSITPIAHQSITPPLLPPSPPNQIASNRLLAACYIVGRRREQDQLFRR